MQRTSIQRIIGILLMIFSLTMLPPVLVSLIYDDGALIAFLTAFAVIYLTGLVIWLPVRGERRELRLRDGFVIVAAFWSVLSLSGALPFMIAEHPHLHFTDAVFESVSGFTTTGATIIASGLDTLPHSIIYHRAQLQWLGGMGIIVLAVAILPMLGVGGMQLFRAETPGPMKDNKLTPRVTETAKALWYVYLAITLACAAAYGAAGMNAFDAITHSYSTVAIGGFSSHDASIGYFNSITIELIAVFFMLLSGMNFALHFLAWRHRSLRPYRDSELYLFLTVMLGGVLIVAVYLYAGNVYAEPLTALRNAMFHVVSVGTTTGFVTTGFAQWPGFLPVLILMISFIGGCAGSTGGGLKVIRFMLLIRQGLREIRRMVHPNAQMPVKVNRKVVPELVVQAVWGFFSLYVGSFLLIFLVLLGTGMDQVSAWSAVASCMNNTGPGLGAVTMHYADASVTAKWALSFAMLLGRLELFPILVLMAPAFWRN
ncbi:MAG: potassium transporter [Gammaproteobacteria bacterium RBG_16_57_12]|nr:MAG: potassium transporter [Gammaproteobacteria bacterium RBG_16_57_12]